MRTEHATVGDTDRADALQPEIRIVEALNDDELLMPCARCARTATHLVKTGDAARLLCETCARDNALDHQLAHQRRQRGR